MLIFYYVKYKNRWVIKSIINYMLKNKEAEVSELPNRQMKMTILAFRWSSSDLVHIICSLFWYRINNDLILNYFYPHFISPFLMVSAYFGLHIICRWHALKLSITGFDSRKKINTIAMDCEIIKDNRKYWEFPAFFSNKKQEI